MRKEVKRSLLLWPAVASVTITAVSWFAIQIDGDRVTDGKGLSSWATPARLLPLQLGSDAIVTAVEITARNEHGNRAMRMPQRVAEAFGVGSSGLKAPIRDEQQELAGLAFVPTSATAPTIHQLAKGILQGDMTAADRLSRNRPEPEIQQGMGLVQSLRDRLERMRKHSAKLVDDAVAVLSSPKIATMMSNDPSRSTAGAEDQAVTALGPTQSDAQPVENPQLALHSAVVIPASVLPPSNRALGRRQLSSPALQDSSTADTSRNSLAISDRSLEASNSQTDLERMQSDDLATSSDSSETVFPIIIDRPDSTIREEGLVGQPRGVDVSSPAGWPVTTKLDEQLQTLNSMALNSRPATRDQLVSLGASPDHVTDWTEDVASRLEELRSLPRLGEDRAGVLIDELGVLASEGQRRAEGVEDRTKQIQWLGTSYAVTRRVAIWKLVWEVTRSGNKRVTRDDANADAMPLSDAIVSVRVDLDQTGDAEGWNRYLLLDEIDRCSMDSNGDDRVILAQRFLSRLSWHRLSPEQQLWLERESVSRLARLVRPWAQDVVDYATLLQQIELQETDALDLSSINIAAAIQTLRYAENPLANQIAEAIDTYYRNANLRIALSGAMLQRFMPEMETKSVGVNSMILGSRVRGRSLVETDLEVQLLPSPDRWTLRLNTSGDVITRSTGYRSSVAVRTLSQSQFQSDTDIEITTHGVNLNGSEVDVRGSTRLGSIETDYDQWPLVGPLARSIAERRYRSLAPTANRIASRTIQNRIEHEIDEMVETKVDSSSDKLSQLVLGPLGRLQLDPKVTDMQTTEQRLLARFRVAGDWQMAAFTPRPRAPSSSLMSAQVHQSALNNMLEQLVPHGEPMLIRDLFQQTASIFGQSDFDPPDDLPDDVTIQFSRTRPITVEIENDRLWITLRIVRLRRANSVDLTQCIVRAAYMPQIDGMKASLVRDGHLRISGPRMSMRERLPARTIFNKVFSSNREIPVTVSSLRDHPSVEGLAISQLELRNGWLALAVSEEDAPRIALAP